MEDGEPVCPYCGCEKSYALMGGLTFKCSNKECKKKYSVTAGRIFKASKIKLRIWFIAIYLITSHKKGISSHQLAKDCGVTQKTAWFILQRVREMLKEKAPELLEGPIEIDEAVVAGRESNKHLSKRRKGTQGGVKRQAVFGILDRGGYVVVQPIPDRKSKILVPIMRNNGQEGATIYTDEHGGYYHLNKWYDHQIVRHSLKEYVRGEVSTNGIENFWSIFKRGLYGVYQHSSRKHLQRYCEESAYRYNTKDLKEVERLDHALIQANGRRLTSSRLIS